MICLGITGGLGSGKSTVACFFEEWGAEVHDADTIAKTLLNTDARLKREIQSFFGEDIYSEKGELRPGLLADKAFSSRKYQHKLNALVHPRVEEKIREIRRDVQKKGTRLLVIEASMLFEAGTEKEYNAVLVITAPQSVRLERALHRGTLTKEQILFRMSLQMPEEEKIRRADYVIHNDGSLDMLKTKTREIYQTLMQSF